MVETDFHTFDTEGRKKRGVLVRCFERPGPSQTGHTARAQGVFTCSCRASGLEEAAAAARRSVWGGSDRRRWWWRWWDPGWDPTPAAASAPAAPARPWCTYTLQEQRSAGHSHRTHEHMKLHLQRFRVLGTSSSAEHTDRETRGRVHIRHKPETVQLCCFRISKC